MIIVVEDVFGVIFGYVVNGCVWRGFVGFIVDLFFLVFVYLVFEFKLVIFCFGIIYCNI